MDLRPREYKYCLYYIFVLQQLSCGHEVARDCFHAEANLGKAWMTASITEVHMQYKAFTTKEIVADIRLGIGLRGINVTLIGTSTIVYTSITIVFCMQALMLLYYISVNLTATPSNIILS